MAFYQKLHILYVTTGCVWEYLRGSRQSPLMVWMSGNGIYDAADTQTLTFLLIFEHSQYQMSLVLNEKHCNFCFLCLKDDDSRWRTWPAVQHYFKRWFKGIICKKGEQRYSLLDILPSSFNGLAEEALLRNWPASTDGWLPLASFSLRGDKNEKLEVEFGVGMWRSSGGTASNNFVIKATA